MAAYARLKNEFMEDEKYQNLMTWFICFAGRRLVGRFLFVLRFPIILLLGARGVFSSLVVELPAYILLFSC